VVVRRRLPWRAPETIVAASVSVVIPAHNAERTLGRVLRALAEEVPDVRDVIVVDDASTDATGDVARAAGATVVRNDAPLFAGGARNRGWDAAGGDSVVFLDADAIPAPGWGAGLTRALAEFPGAIVGCARTFADAPPWSLVAHLQIETPYLPIGEPRRVPFVSSYCMAVPRAAPLRWDSSYGGEDAIFCADALDAGIDVVFDPRFTAVHDHLCRSFTDVRRRQRRLAYGMARTAGMRRRTRKRVLARFPLHYFGLVRLPVIYRRLGTLPELRAHFTRLLPRLVVAEWTMGFSAVRYAMRPPPLREHAEADFR
jgi:glycosyltransferase involved in cell wall biosynthesis